MIVPDWMRLVFYIVVIIVPIWQDFFTKSTDYSLRGLAMPTLASVGAAAAVILARTKSKNETPTTPTS